MKKTLSRPTSHVISFCLIVAIAATVFGVSMQRGRAAGTSAMMKAWMSVSPQDKVAPQPGGLQAPGSMLTERTRQMDAPPAGAAKQGNPQGLPKPSALQTVVLSDDFEGATTFVLANSTVNAWVIGTAAANGGTKGAYVSNDGGVSNAYTNTVTSGNHIYAPIIVPVGETAVVLSFDWRGIADFDANADFDYLRVSVRSSIPVAGTMPLAAEQIPVTFSGQDNFTRAYVNLPASVATGTTQFLVFSWVDDTSVGTLPSAIDNVLVTSQVPAPLSGTKTVPGDYPSIGAAVANVNANGADTSGGSLIFNVAAGSVFTETPFPLTASGSSATNRIIVQKSGAGANPKIIAEGGGNFGAPQTSLTAGVTSTSDAIIAINSADFVTFDGIDVQSSSVSGVSPFSKIEYGYLIRNNNILANVTTINGAQNNIIQNTSVTLDRRKTAPASTIGILQTASTATGGGSTPTSAAQANSGNKYYNYTITNAIAGIFLLGNVTFPDLTCEAGVTGAVTQSTIGAATANDIGNAAVQTWGIRAQNQSGVKIFKTEIRNVMGTSSTAASTVDGIFLDNTGSTATSVGTNEISGNIIHDLNNTNTAASVVAGIRENLTNNAGSVLNLFNNFVYNLNSSSTVTATRRIIGFRVQDSGSGAAATHNIAYNSVRMSPTNVATSNSTFEIGTSTPIFKVQNNVFANFTGAQAGAAKHYCWVSTSSSAIGGAGAVSDFNVLHVNNTTNGFTGLGSATDFATLANWQTILAGAGPDDNSWAQNPQFISPTNLHIDPTVATPVESHATPLLALTTVDIDGDGRNATTPDIGADEGTFVVLPANDIAATVVNNPANGSALLNGSTIATPQATFSNVGTANQTSVNVRLTITGPGGYSYLDNQTIATLNSGNSFTQTFAAAPAFTTAGNYTATAINLFADSNAANDSVSSFFTVFDTITSGSVNVGTGQAYTSLTNPAGVFNAINAGVVTSNITVNITSDLTIETGTVALNQFAAGFTALIQPSGGAARLVSGSSANALIDFNGADGVTINGLNTGGNSLTIRNTNNAGLATIRLINDASSNGILNCTIEGGMTTASGGVVFIAAGTTTGNDNNTISGCIVRDRTDAAAVPANLVVSLNGSTTALNTGNTVSSNQLANFTANGFATSSGATSNNWTVTDNDISQNATRATTVFGINTGGMTGTNLISGNSIHGFVSSGANAILGFLVGNSLNLTISRNRIYDFQTTALATGVIEGLEFDGASGGAANITVVNNMVSLAPTLTTAQAVIGIQDFAFGGNTFTANHNTVFVGGTASGATPSWAMKRGDLAPTTYTARNNLLFNNRTGGTSSHFADGDDSANTGTFVSNFNFFAGTGATAANFMDYGSNSAGTPVSFAAWQAGPPARDANSVANTAATFVVSDYFVNAPNGDLHLKATAAAVLSAGTSGTGVTNDFDNDPRPASNPDIGADELVMAVAGVIPAGTYYNASANDGDSLGGNVSVTNMLTLNGKLSTGANTLTIGCAASIVGAGPANYVIGNLKKTYCGTGSFDFTVGTANGYSPVTVNVTAGTFPADFTVKAVQGPQPNIASPGAALQRYWTLTATGVTANLTFNYLDPTDIVSPGSEANFVIFKYDGAFTMPGGSVNTVANTASITGVTSFSDWTLAQPGAPTDVAMNWFKAESYSAGPNSPTAGALLRWQTGLEVSNLGFNIYRDQAGKRVRVTSDMIAGSAFFVGSRTVLGAGRSYVWRDTQGVSADAEYWLEAVDINGSNAWYGPVRAVSSGVKKSSEDFEPNSKVMHDLGGDQSASDATTPVESKPKQARMSAERLTVQAAAANQPAIKIAVRREGWYRIAQSDLVAAGLDPRVDPLALQLLVDGQEQPISVLTDKDGRVSAVEFYGLGADSPYTSLRTYWLAAGEQPGKRIEQVKSAGTAPAGGSFPYTIERRDHTIYFAALRNGDKENFFGAVIARDPVDQSLTVQNLDTGSSATSTIEVALQGVTNVPHSIKVELNGSNVGVISFNSQSGGLGQFNVASSLLKEGQNVVRLTSLGVQGDVSLVEYIRLTYRHRYTADSDALRVTAAGKQQITIDGFSSSAIRVLDVTNPNAVQELMGTVQPQQGGYRVALNLQSSGQRKLLAIAGEMAKPSGLTANIPSSWRQPANGADLIILTRRDFFASLDPLRSLRQKQGYSVALVDIDDVYDEFSYGQKTPQAVKDFCAYAAANWKKAPRFVMLAGDASLDPKNYLGFGDGDLVPTRLIDTQLMETASDDALVDFNGDGVPDLSIGRLPVRSADEALLLAKKIAAYDGQRSTGTLLLVSDHNDTFDFESASNLLRSLIPANIRVEAVDRAHLDDATAKARVIEAINRGQLVVNYTGHGSVNQWRADILTSADAAALTNGGELSLFVMMTCLNGYFQDAALDSLGESLLKAEGGGAVAVWGSSGMTTPDFQSVMNQQVYRMIFNGTPITIGEATRSAKAAVSDVDVRRTWILLGDPTTRLAR